MQNTSSPCTLSPVALFCLGQIVATPGSLALLAQTRTDVIALLMRHAKGDWGSVCDADARLNNQAVTGGARVISAYELGDCQEKLWIITNADRQATTLLLSAEY